MCSVKVTIPSLVTFTLSGVSDPPASEKSSCPRQVLQTTGKIRAFRSGPCSNKVNTKMDWSSCQESFSHSNTSLKPSLPGELVSEDHLLIRACLPFFSEVSIKAVTRLDNKAAHCHAPVLKMLSGRRVVGNPDLNGCYWDENTH